MIEAGDTGADGTVTGTVGWNGARIAAGMSPKRRTAPGGVRVTDGKGVAGEKEAHHGLPAGARRARACRHDAERRQRDAA